MTQYTPQQLIALSRLSQFTIGNSNFISQQPYVTTAADRAHYAPLLIPQFVLFHRDLERATGHAWKITSYITNSPSHKKAQSIDFAPAIAPHAEKHYGVRNGSDPILHKRLKLITQLQTLKDIRYDPRNDLGVFIESDHLHVQALAPNAQSHPISIVKWGLRKPIYGDTDKRLLLPDTVTGYMRLDK